ncbi:MAG TPA: hypothetical protein VGJ55_12285 [Pyrinomonadaceae bacterium]
MSKSYKFATLLVAVFLIAVGASVAQAQAIRTWVSATGDDVNPCSRTAPCKTFAGTQAKTTINGEIDCLDPGGYGTVTIAKSITIDCEDTQGATIAGILTAISVSLGASNVNDPLRTVRIRGLDINGTGLSGQIGSRTGARGIHVTVANDAPIKLFVEKVIIHGFVNEGIFFNGPGGDLVVNDSAIIDNGTSGIRTLSTLAGSAGIIHVTVNNVNASLNQQGFRFEGNSFGVVKNSVASNNTLNGFVVNPVSIGDAEMNIVDSTANNNRQFGVYSGGTGQAGVVRIFNLTAFHNTSLQLEQDVGGSILSNGRNHIGTPSDAPAPFVDQ